MSPGFAQGTGPRGGRARYGCATLMFAVVALMVFSGAMRTFWTRVDQRRFPWAYEDTGRPTLTGTWVGTLSTNRGLRRGLLLELRLAPLNFDAGGSGRRGAGRMFRRATSEKLLGELRMCGGPRGEQHFLLHGNNVNDDASRFRVTLRVADSTAPDGLAPSNLRGTWNQRDSLKVEADLYVRQGASAITNSADPETGTPQPGALHRGQPAEFRTVCDHLWDAR